VTVHWTPSALADVKAIEAYITRHSYGYGRSVVRRLFDRSAVLADFPLIGGVVEEYDDPSLRELIEVPYRIIYRVLDAQVDVVAVVHAARRLPRGL
jgi:toxin ParE1/3/4